MQSTLINTNTTIGIFKTHLDAEDAIKSMQKSGFKMNELSIVGKDYHTQDDVVGYYNAGERMKYWGKQGAFWGGIIVLGAGLLSIGIPKDSVIEYESAVKAGHFLVIAKGSDQEMEHARSIFRSASSFGEPESFQLN